LKTANDLRADLAGLAEKDAEVFEPLSRAYGLPRNTDAEKKYREETLEKALKAASEVPFEIMQKSVEAMEIHKELAEKGTRIAVSDVGVGVLFCKAALMGAGLNVFINTKLMKDRAYAENLNGRVRIYFQRELKRLKIYWKVEAELR
jgi:formiminotetrahydrofolate cyclodeaminase